MRIFLKSNKIGHSIKGCTPEPPLASVPRAGGFAQEIHLATPSYYNNFVKSSFLALNSFITIEKEHNYCRECSAFAFSAFFAPVFLFINSAVFVGGSAKIFLDPGAQGTIATTLNDR